MKEFIERKAFAKINLFLDITGKRADGYHELNNVMQKIGLCDNVKISVKSGKDISVICSDPQIPCDEKNIAFKAAKAYLEQSGIQAEINLEIEKKIPLMAGLGGSSADGAAVLGGLNEIFGTFDNEALEKIGAQLGADVPFCLRGGTALCEGIGDKMTNLNDFHRFFVIVQPKFKCNTAAAYKLYDRSKKISGGNLNAFLNNMNENPKRQRLFNVFEEIYQDERIYEIKKRLVKNGAGASLMSGSGSAVYGIFDNETDALKAAEKMNYPFVCTAENNQFQIIT